MIFPTGLKAREPAAAPKAPLTVGQLAKNRFLTPTGQILTPAGQQVALPGMRPQVLALSPDGHLLVTAGKANQLVVLDSGTGSILQKVPMPGKTPVKEAADESEDGLGDASAPANGPGAGRDTGAQLSFTGLVFSPDGRRIYLSNVDGNVKVFAVDEHHEVSGLGQLAVPEARAPKRKPEIPTGLAVAPDGKHLFVVGNLGNRLYELDLTTGQVSRSWPTGVAPFDVVLAAGKAYVSNTGGRRPEPGDTTAEAGRGTRVRVDPSRRVTMDGSVTVIDLASGKVKVEIPVEFHASGLAASPRGKYVAVANSGSDTISVIDTGSDRVVEKIWARQTPADLFGAQPNALAFDRSGKLLFACNGTQNAVAVFHFEPEERESKMLGLIPVGWFPGAVRFDAAQQSLWVANIKGIGAAKIFKPGEQVKLRTKDFFGTLSLVPLPSEAELKAMTAVALSNMRYPKLREALLPARPDQAPRPVPERAGEPSVFKHVIYVIKENRSYDQVLGDVEEGNGYADLCTFGLKYTPNQHKLAREFVLLDNTYCAGVQSGDGHQWTDSGIANDYVERQLTAGWPRSYPGGKAEDGLDALAWASSGFIWDDALAHGKTFRNYGEWQITEAGWADKARKDKPVWRDFWTDYKNGTSLTRLSSYPAIETLRPHSKLDSVGWDLRVPDVVRAAEFIKELKAFEEKGTFPNLVILFLPNDHTGGTRGKSPTPGAQVADNDLALGHVVEALSHSTFWPETCLFSIEDDPQNGWDHVSGYRTTCYIASPYTKRRQTVSTPYNQLSLMRTIELILGLPPMNQLDATATPMTDCFVGTPDLAPFDAVPNLVPLDQMNARVSSITDPVLRQDALISERLPLDEPDRCPEDVLNRILWHAMKGTQTPFPDWAVQLVEDDD